MKTIIEIKSNMNNNESAIAKAIYQNTNGSYLWITYTRSGECKNIRTAYKKIGFIK